MVFTESSCRMTCTPWGKEVKKRLLDRNMKQEEVIRYLNNEGFQIQKGHFTNLLKGIGASSRRAEIEAVSKLLEIPLQQTHQEPTP